MNHLEKLRPLTLLLLRVGVGIIFIHQGYPKLFQHRAETMYSMVHESDLPAYFAYIAGVLELGGGALLIGGLFTRVVGLLLAGEMAIAMWKGDHILLHPFDVERYKLALALGVGALAIATFGGGYISLDRLLFGRGKSVRPAKVKS